MPQLSIIIPVYNAEKTLNRCINSILEQSNGDFEILLINDGSTDNSGVICDSFSAQDHRIKAIHQTNQGAAVARNTGLNLASGEWVVFVDADDYITLGYIPEKFESEMDMYIQNWRFNAPDGEYVEYIPPQIVSEELPIFLQEYAHYDLFRGILCKFCKKSIIDAYKIRFEKGIHLGEDTLFFMDYLQHCGNIQVLGSGDYIYIRPSEGWIRKYNLSLNEVLHYFQLFLRKYDSVHIDLPKLASFIYRFFSSFLSDKDKKTLEWRFSSSVIKLKEISHPKGQNLYLLRLRMMRIVSMFLHY